MVGRILFRSTLLLLCGIWLAGCVTYTSQRDEPRFAGYHRADPSPGVTAAITDREALTPAVVPDQQPPPGQAEAEKAPEDRDYTYQDWYRNRYRSDNAFRFDLSYHLYGSYYYRDLRSRYGLQYQRRWHRLPWYAGRWDDPYWYDSWYDPWYGYYDPWYSYYDPWYYNPYGYYGHSYGYYGGYGWYPWYGTYATGSVQTKAGERRPRGRRDLPTGLVPVSDSSLPAVPLRTRNPVTGLEAGSSVDKGKAATSQSGPAESRGTSTRSAGRSRWQGSGGSSASSGGQARSSSRGSSTARSSSSSSGKSSSTKSARASGRKP